MLIGCNRGEQISSYTVPKPELVYEANHVDREDEGERPAGPMMGADVSKSDRLIGAIVPRGEQTWFFKMTGPDGAVQDQMEEFLELIQSLEFPADDGKPSWTAPDGWMERPGSGMRVATLLAESDEGDVLQTTVIPLPSSAGDETELLLSNVNRWRTQVGLPEVSRSELFSQKSPVEEVRQIEVGGIPVTLVNLAGIDAPSRVGRQFGPSPAGEKPTADSGLKYNAPEGWQPGKSGGLRMAAFVVTENQEPLDSAGKPPEGTKAVEITIIPLAAAAGELLPNVNRWAQQVGMKEMDAAELKSSLKPISLGDVDGQYVELFGDEQAILGAIAVSGDRSWFVKLMGDTELAKRERENFRAFVESVRLPE